MICCSHPPLQALECCGKSRNPCIPLTSLRFHVPRSRDDGRAFRNYGSWTTTVRKMQSKISDHRLLQPPLQVPESCGKSRNSCIPLKSLRFMLQRSRDIPVPRHLGYLLLEKSVKILDDLLFHPPLHALESGGKSGNQCISSKSLRFMHQRSRDNGRAFQIHGPWTTTLGKWNPKCSVICCSHPPL